MHFWLLERICFSGSKCVDVQSIMRLLTANNRKTDFSCKEICYLNTKARDKASSSG